MSGVNRQVLLSCLRSDLPSDPLADKKSPFCDPKDIALTTLLGSVFKKFEDPNPEADAKAISKFLAVNNTAGAWEIATDRLNSWDEELVGTVKKYLDNFFHPGGELLVPSFDSLFIKGDLGPGANLLGRGGDFYTKMFSSKLTVTSLELYSSYRRSIANLPSWLIAEDQRLRSMGGPTVVEGNRTSCVPKNVDISRTICTEPTLNMWYQLGLGNIIRERLSQFFGIDLSTVAEVNREMARLGSIDQEFDSFVEKRRYDENRFCTIDLESASDSMSLKMLKFMLPKWVYELLISLRSPVTRLPDGSRVELNMVSTMGNGFTFPLQTLLFSCIVAAAYEQAGIPRLNVCGGEPNFSVFGDDIIVVRKVYERVLRALELLGFTVNADKSFFEGPFRESCGSDFYKGHFVRPVYIRHLDGPQDTYVAFNKLIRWASVHGFSIPRTAQYLLKKARFNPVPIWEADDAGFKVPEWMASSKSKRYSRSGIRVYKACVTKRSIIRLKETSIWVPRGQSHREYNPSGLLVAVTRGEFRDGELTPRQGGGRVVWVRRLALSWDIPPVSDLRGFLSCERLAFSNARMAKLAFGRAVWPVAGQVEGDGWKTRLYRTLEYSM
jgi:hypothetical protein